MELGSTGTVTSTPGGEISLGKQYVTFRVGKLLFGVNVDVVQEIIRSQPMTPVPLAPPMVRGLVNLRGQIITALDMRAMLGLEPFPADATPTNVVVRADDEVMSILVDEIGDVLEVDPSAYEPTPEMIAPPISRVTHGVVKLDRQLLLILNTTVCSGSEISQ